MVKAEDAPCPVCDARNTLAIDSRMWALPLGTFSVAGAQSKIVVRMRPVLTCSACGLEHWGEYHGAAHAVFAPIHSAMEQPGSSTAS